MKDLKTKIDNQDLVGYDLKNPGENNLVLLVRLLQKEKIKLAIDDALSKG